TRISTPAGYSDANGRDARPARLPAAAGLRRRGPGAAELVEGAGVVAARASLRPADRAARGCLRGRGNGDGMADPPGRRGAVARSVRDTRRARRGRAAGGGTAGAPGGGGG